MNLVEFVRLGDDDARMAASIIDEGVMSDTDQPYRDVALLVELVPVSERALEGGLSQVVRGRGVEYQSAGIAPQARNRSQQLLAKRRRGLHGTSTRHGRNVFR